MESSPTTRDFIFESLGEKAYVEVSANDTLAKVRELILEELDSHQFPSGDDTDFVFRVNRIRISSKQEMRKTAFGLLDKEAKVELVPRSIKRDVSLERSDSSPNSDPSNETAETSESGRRKLSASTPVTPPTESKPSKEPSKNDALSPVLSRRNLVSSFTIAQSSPALTKSKNGNEQKEEQHNKSNTTVANSFGGAPARSETTVEYFGKRNSVKDARMKCPNTARGRMRNTGGARNDRGILSPVHGSKVMDVEGCTPNGLNVVNPLRRAAELHGQGHAYKVTNVERSNIQTEMKNLGENPTGPSVSRLLQNETDKTEIFADKLFNGSKRPSQTKPTPNKRPRRTVGFVSIADQRKRKQKKQKPPPKEEIIDLVSDGDDETKEATGSTADKSMDSVNCPRMAEQEKPGWTMDVFRPFVERALDEWKQDSLFTKIGLLATDTILKDDENFPGKDDTSHPYNLFFNLIIKKIADEFKLGKSSKKAMRIMFRSFREEWEAMIREKQIIQSPSKEKVDEIDVDLSPKQRQMKEEFEKTKKEVLDSLPEEVKSRFGEQFFSKWGKSVLPCLVLSPYSVPPGGIRDMWFDMYEKLKKQDRLAPATNLVYWYGFYDDPRNAYSFVATYKLTTYAEGEKKNMHKVPNQIQKKLDREEKLSAPEKMLVEGLAEMEEDREKEPDERHGRMIQAFLEDWEFPYGTV